jgi:DNA helicase II / ATP-dependent DNA helicase PcrA
MRFHADLHIHSKYSRATSRDLDLEHLTYWARRKGITVVGTGDFTHPVRLAELKEKLVPAEPGLFRLRDDIERNIAATLPVGCQTPVRFMLSVEISTIYKKGPLTRKIHHLLYAPDFATADRIAASLGRIGNIHSDGRPILGLDSRHLLEITLESGPGAYLVPAHIWTPWFAVLGSKSGFDSITECYGDLADHVFALETGLSSDPPMNWRLSILDRFRLVSNSDAHSPGKLGRETTLYDTDLDYFAIRRALETGQGYVGTVEFFPEEGKYHLDGHRKCNLRTTPEETAANGGRCPVCGQPTTIGVLNRIEALADRGEDNAPPPATAGEVTNLVPLPEILSELAGSGPSSKTVERNYDRLIGTLGPELAILKTIPIEDIARAESSLLAEAITRLRAGKVIRDAGYDGEYGVIRLFEQSELRRAMAGGVLFDVPVAKAKPTAPTAQKDVAAPMPMAPAKAAMPPAKTGDLLAALDDDQRNAAETTTGPLLISAGPGSGKTRTLTYRIVHLIAACGVPASSCLAITFTRRAAGEMKERLARLIPGTADQIAVHTFHSLGLAILREHPNTAGLQRGFRVASETERAAALAGTMGISASKAQSLLRAISKAKRDPGKAGDEIAAALSAYQQALSLRNWIDFDDLVGLAVRALAGDPWLAALYRERFKAISVDEFQDIDAQQYQLVTLIAQPDGNICVIGDPHQAIYGFRGADAACFAHFKRDYPAHATIALKRNYRSSGTIVTASSQIIAAWGDQPIAEIVRGMEERITIHAAPTERAEAEFVIQAIEQLIGGHSFFSIDSGRASDADIANLSFADIAVLYRTDAQSGPLVEAFARSGIPFKKHSHEALAAQPAVQALLQELGDAIDGEGLALRLDDATMRLKTRDTTLDGGALDQARAQMKSLAARAMQDGTDFTDLLAHATEADLWDPRADRVSLLTLHAAKGLEFPVVFIVGLEDGLLPLYWGTRDECDLAEERRLFYVGMTRAQDRLILSRAIRRAWRGGLRNLEPSPFLNDIESALATHQRRDRQPKKPEDKQLKLF